MLAALIPIGPTEKGETALIRAAEAGHREIVEYLLPLSDDNGAWALLGATHQSRSGAVEQLLAVGVDPNGGGAECPPLFIAVQKGHADIVQQLLTAGADPNRRCSTLYTTLSTAVYGGHLAIVEQLIAANADLNAQGSHGRTALMTAVNIGVAGGGHHEDSLAIAERLVAAGADLDIRNR